LITVGERGGKNTVTNMQTIFRNVNSRNNNFFQLFSAYLIIIKLILKKASVYFKSARMVGNKMLEIVRIGY
jgi:hypothetical protein